MGKIIGIDLGTTNSCVAVFEGGEPVVIANAEGARTTPSVVAFSKTGERMVGQVAKRQAITNPDRTIISIKRDMGNDKKVAIDDKNFTPQEISAMILQKLKSDAEAYLGQTVTEAVITAPMHSVRQQRTQVRLQVLMLRELSMNLQRQLLLMVLIRNRHRRFSYSTLAAVHLTYPFLILMTALSKFLQLQVITDSAVMTSMKES